VSLPGDWKEPASLPGYYLSGCGRLFRGLHEVATRRDERGCRVATAFVRDVPGTVRIARLVGECFCPEFKPELRARYRNGDGMDCRKENLEWVSRSTIAKGCCAGNRFGKGAA
jgi:hypothetical protein